MAALIATELSPVGPSVLSNEGQHQVGVLCVCVTYTHSCLPWRLWLLEEVPPPASVAFGVDQSH